jgi:hypothetical protein
MYTTTSRYIVLSTMLAALALSSCAANHAPEGWLPSRAQMGADPYGAWAYIELGDGVYTANVQGEYIGVDDSAAFIGSVEGTVRVPFERVYRAQLRAHEVNTGSIGAWGGLGTLSTLTHGWIGAITIPVWVSLWIGAATAEASSGTRMIMSVDWDDKRIASTEIGSWFKTNAEYSRFPQGIPNGIDRTKLRGKQSFPYWK